MTTTTHEGDTLSLNLGDHPNQFTPKGTLVALVEKNDSISLRSRQLGDLALFDEVRSGFTGDFAMVTWLGETYPDDGFFAWRFRVVEPEAQPVKSDFDFEAGQEIGDASVLDLLPVGTVVTVGDGRGAALVKLWSGEFARPNRYSTRDNGAGVVFETYRLKGALEDADMPVLIAFVPSI